MPCSPSPTTQPSVPNKPRCGDRGILMGIGIACFIDKAGTGPSANLAKRGGLHGGWESAIVRVHSDGKVLILAGSHSHTAKVTPSPSPKIAADRLGVPVDHIRVVEGDTDLIPFGNGTWGRAVHLGRRHRDLSCGG